MLCEKCKKMACGSRNEAVALSAKLGIGGRHSVSKPFGSDWYPGNSRKELEDWCAKNCKEVKEEITPPSPLKDKWVQSSNKNLKTTDKKKD
jgi:hypothetical protein